MSKIKKLIILTSVLIALTLLGWYLFSYQDSLNSKLNTGNAVIDYQIKSGSSLSGVIYDLANKKIIKHPRYALWYARLSGRGANMKAGDYRLTQNLTTKNFLENILTGKVIQYSLTIIEGWSFKQLLKALNDHPQIKHTITGLSDSGDSEIMIKLGYPGVHPEGQFLPDTYHFPKGLPDTEFLQRAYLSMQKVLKDEWEKRAVGLIYKSATEALVMASIVEKETGNPDEREQIAGVFIRRLEKRMRLQTDPTVIYGMGERYKGNLRKRDLLEDTPYNTYRRFGLPPTPIALPGRKAIYAALHPAEGDTLYFVSRGDGSHVFSETLDEHNKAVIKYQLKGRVRSFSSFKHKSKNDE